MIYGKYLKDESKNKIRSHFESNFVPNQRVRDIEKEIGKTINSDFDSVLSDISNLFVEFRCIFDGMARGNLTSIIENLRTAIKSRVTELEIDKKIEAHNLTAYKLSSFFIILSIPNRSFTVILATVPN